MECRMRFPLMLASLWLLSGLLTCYVTQAQAERISKHTLQKSKQELAEIESAFYRIKEVFSQDFGTRIKNFFSPKSNRPIPRPRDHIPAVVQELAETSSSLEEAVVMAALLSDTDTDTHTTQDDEEKINVHRRLWKLITKAFHS